MPRRCRLGAPLAGLLLLLGASGAGAQPSEADIATARRLGQEAFVALDAKDFAKAAELFSRAEQLYHAPTLVVGLARAQAALGRVVEAQENYRRVMREVLQADASDAYRKAVSDAATEIVAVEKQIAWVTIRVAGPADAEVLIDGVALPRAAVGVGRAVDPGPHLVVARAAGFEESRQRLDAAPGGQHVLELKVSKKAAPAAGQGAAHGPADGGRGASGAGAEPTEGGSSPVQTAGFVSIGVGAAGLLLGTITGILAMNAHSDLVSGCPDEKCPEAERDTLDQYELLHPLSTAGFVVGGVLAAAGVVVVLVAPDAEPEGGVPAPDAPGAPLSVRVGPGAAALTVRF